MVPEMRQIIHFGHQASNWKEESPSWLPCPYRLRVKRTGSLGGPTKFARVGRSSITPMIRNTQEVGIDELPKSLFVFSRRYYGWQLVLGNNKWRLDPILKLLVPSILPKVVYDTTYQFTALSIHSHKKRVIHHIDWLKQKTNITYIY